MFFRWIIVAIALPIGAQPVFTNIFPPEEFEARRAAIMEKIGDGVAVLQGTTERPGEQPLRQSNQFFYVCGVVEPRAILMIDGRAKKTMLFLNPRVERREKMMFGPSVDWPIETHPREEFAKVVAQLEGRTIYAPFRPEVLGSASSSDPAALAKNTKADPWDGRSSREDAFIEKLKSAAPGSAVKDLDPIIDAMRSIKSPREIAILREATNIAGWGIIEAMRDAKPGMYEYELQADAEFVFKKYGSYGAAYFALIATGQNTYYSHYHLNAAQLKDGDLVQFDYAPDYKNYSSDVTRVFPANGKFTPRQREFYTIYLRLYQALMKSIEVHKTAAEIVRNAVVKMDGIMTSYPFTDDRIKAAAAKFVERYRTGRTNSLGHSVGMEVHDVRNVTQTLEPGQLFTIEPAMLIEEEHVGIRLEDMILMTPTGYENLSAFVPVEIGEIEKMMAEPGLSDALRKHR
jgi:Xaa-Pro aminopeptidase